MKKIIVLLLALIMVVSAFAACGPTNPKPTKPSSSASTPPGPGPDPDVDESEILNVDIDSVDYGGDTVTVFYWSPLECKEFEVSETDIIGNDINDAVYRKNLYTEQALGIEFNFISGGELWGYNEIPAYLQDLAALEDDTPVDVISGSIRMLPSAMIEGYLKDMTAFHENLDFEKAWWPGEVVDCFSIKDRLYFVSGDISTNLLCDMLTIFVNKTLLESRGTTYATLMQNVLAGNWTLDDMYKLCEGMHIDVTNDGPSVDDKFGFVTNWYCSDALYNGAGFEYMKVSNADDEVFKISPDMYGLAVDEYVTYMTDWATTGDFYCGPKGDAIYTENFKNGNSIFALMYAVNGIILQSTDIDFAVVPPPKLNSAQKKYYTSIGTQYCTYGIGTSSENWDRAAQTIQCLGYYAYQLTTPAIFEVTFKGKFAKDQYSIDTFDLMRNSLVYDPGKAYDTFICGSKDWQYYLPNIVSWTISGGDEWSTDKVWGSEFNATKQETVRKLIKAANEKIIAFLEIDS